MQEIQYNMCLLFMRDLVGDPPLLVPVVVPLPVVWAHLPHGRRQPEQPHRHRRPPHRRGQPELPPAPQGQPHLVTNTNRYQTMLMA